MNGKEVEVERVKVITLHDNKNQKENYLLSEKVLGKGKYGTVHKAVNERDPSKVYAVKVIRLQSEKVKNECLKELEIIRRLPDSPNLVKIYSQHFESENNFYIFEELCSGGNLYELIRRRKDNPFTEEEVFQLFFQLSKGVIALQHSNIYHEDLKPQNILIEGNLFKITDFGISQFIGNVEVNGAKKDSSEKKESDMRRGTLIYMPPEKLKGTTFTPTSKTEMFSLGVTLFEVIFGSHPYLTKTPTDYRNYLKMLQEAQPKLPE
jgi:serine/threonine protein kinase